MSREISPRKKETGGTYKPPLTPILLMKIMPVNSGKTEAPKERKAERSLENA
jgi:hypothetical protein